jgi:hypothetical protein
MMFSPAGSRAGIAAASLGGRGSRPAAAPAGRLRARLRVKAMRQLYDRWRELQAQGSLPPLRRFDPGRLAGLEWLFTVVVDRTVEPALFRVAHVGEALASRLGRPLDGEPVGLIGAELPGSQEAAYRRCARTCGPCYEHARFALGDGQPVAFERLLLPFSDNGRDVTHLLGMAVFTDLAHN